MWTPVSNFIKKETPVKPATLLLGTPSQVFSRKFCKVFSEHQPKSLPFYIVYWIETSQKKPTIFARLVYIHTPKENIKNQIKHNL